MKKIFFYSFFIILFMNACGQSPDVKIHIYSRITLPGAVPENDKVVFPKTYFIYAEVKKGTPVAAEGCWIDGKYYSMSKLEKVNTPVIVSDLTVNNLETDTLVKKTTKEVYQLTIGEEKDNPAKNDAEKKLLQENQFVLIMKINGKQQYATSATIKELAPAAMM